MPAMCPDLGLCDMFVKIKYRQLCFIVFLSRCVTFDPPDTHSHRHSMVDGMKSRTTKSKRYSIGEVAQRLGLSIHRLRAWERRYGVVTPARSAGGTRRYSQKDITRFRLLSEATSVGYRIGSIVKLDNTRLQSLLNEAMPLQPSTSISTQIGERLTVEQPVLASIVDRAQHLDTRGVIRYIGETYHRLGPSIFAVEFCQQLLTHLRDLWAAGLVSEAAEGLLTTVVRAHLATAFAATQTRQDGPVVMTATPAGERHDLGLLTVGVVASAAGATVVNLGPQLAADAVADAARQIRPFAVALTVMHLSTGSLRAYLRRLTTALPRDIEIWTGGGMARSRIGRCKHLSLAAIDRHIREQVAGQTTTPPGPEGGAWPEHNGKHRGAKGSPPNPSKHEVIRSERHS